MSACRRYPRQCAADQEPGARVVHSSAAVAVPKSDAAPWIVGTEATTAEAATRTLMMTATLARSLW